MRSGSMGMRGHARVVPGLTLGLIVAGCGDDGSVAAGTGTADGTTAGAVTEATTVVADGTTSGSPTTRDGTGSTGSGTTTPDATEDTTAGDTEGAEVVYPDPDWDHGDPLDHGLDPEALDAFAQFIADNNSDCLVVVHEGVIVGEWYWNGFTADTDADNVYSVTKSITSALVGIAREQGALDIVDPASLYIGDWIGGDSAAVTIQNLISNDSGRHWDFVADYVTMPLQADQTQYAIDLAHDQPPGTWWEYNNAAIQTLERVLEVATGQDVGDFAQAELFEPIGMTASYGRDGAGNPLTYQGVSASCRDLARLGYLYRRGGQWAGGVQVVPQAWVEASLASSTALNSAYGFMWWLNRPGHWVYPSAPLRQEGDGKLVTGGPDALYSAVGAFGQLVMVEPELGYVVVRLGGQPNSGDILGMTFLAEVYDAFAPAILP